MTFFAVNGGKKIINKEWPVPLSSGANSQFVGTTRRAAAEKRAETAPLRKRVMKAENELAQLTRQLYKLDATRANVVAAIARAEEEWLSASEALQTA